MVNFTRDSFCGDVFWDHSLSWEAETPHFTKCFKNSITLIVYSVYWITVVPWIVYHYVQKKGQKKRLWWSWLMAFKLLCTLILIGLFAYDLYLRLGSSNNLFYWSDALFEFGTFCTFLSILGLVIIENYHSVISSLPLSIFWPLAFVAFLPFGWDNYSLNDQPILLAVPAVVLLLVFLTCFSDLDPETLKGQQQTLAPAATASYFSSIFFTWLDPIVVQGFKKPLTMQDLPPAPDYVNVTTNAAEFLEAWQTHVKVNQVNFASSMPRKVVKLWKPMIKTFGLRFFAGNFISLFFTVFSFGGPMFLKLLVNHIEDATSQEWKGYLLATFLFISLVLANVSFHNGIMRMLDVGIQLRSALISAIFRKTLRLSNSARQKFTTGEITNFVSVDCQRLMDSVAYLDVLWRSPLQVIIAMVLIYQELGLAAVFGSIGVALLLPPNIIGSRFMEKVQQKQLSAKDSRIKLMNEILSGIKVLKLYAWEIPFMQRIEGIRSKEMKYVKLAALVWAFMNFTFCMGPFVISIVSFSSFVLADSENHILTPEKVFVCISLFNMVRGPLFMFPFTIKEAISMMVSLQRITSFLNADELEENGPATTNGSSGEKAVEISSGTFSWTTTAPQLQDINIKVDKGSLVAIVGAVGSGKSSILQAILGDMQKLSGQVQVNGSLCYISQQAWIQNLSLKDNILFSQPFKADKYTCVLNACALKPDLHLLSNGDETEIGENGINLSGGQKQRVALARGVYFDSDIYLLDDPLSAVDAHVGKHMFEHVLSSKHGLLKGKTRIWVTNQVSYLQWADHVVVLMEGKICQQGNYAQLMNEQAGALYELVQQLEGQNGGHQEEQKSEAFLDTSEPTEKKSNTEGKLIEDEKSLTGHVPLYIFKDFIQRIGPLFFILFILANFVEHGLHAGGIYWLSSWSDSARDNSTLANNELAYRLGVYAGLGALEAIIQFNRDLLFLVKCAIASKLVHGALLNGVMKSPMAFFDTSPLGRVINRFSNDVDVMDSKIPSQIIDFLWCTMEAVATIVMISIATPSFLIVVVPILILFFLIQRFYVVTSRQLKRIYAVSNSPVFSHFSETVSGAQIIRAYKQNHRFVLESEQRVQANVMSSYLNNASNRWIGTRIGTLANVMIFFTAFFAVLNRDSLSPGLAGLSVTYAINVTMSVIWMVRMACELENNCVALERIFEYTKLPSEAAWNTANTGKNVSIGKEWPAQGRIEFCGYQSRYRPGLDLVLRGVDLAVEPGEKIGICGRTGAGKSSLTLALFRIIEATQGAILIDGLDISALGLHDVRSKLSIIPQDPVLFTGSLRFNLDPIGSHSDAELWKVLELSHLKAHIEKNLLQGLEQEVTEGGANFSVGQRQLICLSRALLRKSKILILDEATAAVDLETDELIQATIRNEFRNCAVLTIAHRLNTILDYDRIVLLSQGQVVEQGNPQILLKTANSSFKAMAKDAGISMAE